MAQGTIVWMAANPPRRGLRLAGRDPRTDPEKYRMLDLKRRRAQIRARRLLGLLD
jgi:hypothetical protein